MYPDKAIRHGILILFLAIFLLSILAFPSPVFSKGENLVYFPNTVYELNIYRIKGKNPGKTLMLIGGIQGNEPGGFLSADLYADMSLEKGNLIVVPRANFYSIILNKRGPNGDMNRKFTHEESATSMEDKIVTILKQLISESDYLLNLHDGSGYYYPEYIDKWRNPKRFGQSIIADCEEYKVPGSDDIIPLGEMAREVVEKVNKHIGNDLYKFRFMNTRTSEKDSIHKEQKKSATYYALNVHNIPAFGVETSKFLPSIDLKVRYHNLVINSFMEMFGIVPQSPGLALDTPSLNYLVVSINGETPIVVKNNETLRLYSGDSINISHIEANYERGLSLDILGYGDMNDYRKDFKIFRETSIMVRKDNHAFGEIPIKILGTRYDKKERIVDRFKVDYFAIETNGSRFLVRNNETFKLVRGEKMKIIDVFPSNVTDITVNFKGFVGDKKNNTGEDRGYVINTGKDLMKRYSLNKKDETYQVIVTRGDKEIGKLIVRLLSPEMDFLILNVNDNRHVLLRSDESVALSHKDIICMEEIQTNLGDKSGIQLRINGHKLNQGEKQELARICNSHRNQINIQKGPILLGKIYIDMEIN